MCINAEELSYLSYLGDEAALHWGALLVAPLVPQRPAQDVADDQDLAAPTHSRDAQRSSGHGVCWLQVSGVFKSRF